MWLVCVIPDSTKGSLLLINVYCAKVVFCKEISEILNQSCLEIGLIRHLLCSHNAAGTCTYDSNSSNLISW